MIQPTGKRLDANRAAVMIQPTGKRLDANRAVVMIQPACETGGRVIASGEASEPEVPFGTLYEPAKPAIEGVRNFNSPFSIALYRLLHMLVES